jgi:ABC-type nitrate/sulfonate/bicarbonate transport system permease component
VRIAGPSALTGAVLAEWLATGNGLGYLMLESNMEAQFSMLWASAVAVTLVSIFLYTAVGVIERGVIRRFT